MLCKIKSRRKISDCRKSPFCRNGLFRQSGIPRKTDVLRGILVVRLHFYKAQNTVEAKRGALLKIKRFGTFLFEKTLIFHGCSMQNEMKYQQDHGIDDRHGDGIVAIAGDQLCIRTKNGRHGGAEQAQNPGVRRHDAHGSKTDCG